MAHEHGIFIRGVPPNHTFEFWWCGERVSMGDFNSRLWDQTSAVAKDAAAFSDGMEFGARWNEGMRIVAKIEQIEEILKLPLCEKCRALIGAPPEVK